MSSSVIVKNSVVAGKKPATAATNKVGELWVNPVDRVIGTFDAAGAPVEVGVTAAKFTAGSVPFAGTGGALTEDNANLFWDKVNKALGIGAHPFAFSKLFIKIATNRNFATFANALENCVGFFDDAGHYIETRLKGSPLVFGTGVAEFMRMTLTGQFGIGVVPASTDPLLTVNDTSVRVVQSKTPASATATGSVGQICWDSGYVYGRVAANTWKRAALTTW